MNYNMQLAKHFREVHFGGNWTTVNYKEQLADVSWQQATIQIHSFNSIATLVYHTGYYVSALIRVLKGEPLNAKDAHSFELPQICSQQDWMDLLGATWSNAEEAARLIELLPFEKLSEPFADEKYGNYLRNIFGIIEHLHYHLGQIVIIKKLLLTEAS